LSEYLEIVAGEGFAVSPRAWAFRKLGKIKEAEADEAKFKEMTAQRK
jgi:hypothetical protein